MTKQFLLEYSVSHGGSFIPPWVSLYSKGKVLFTQDIHWPQLTWDGSSAFYYMCNRKTFVICETFSVVSTL